MGKIVGNQGPCQVGEANPYDVTIAKEAPDYRVGN